MKNANDNGADVAHIAWCQSLMLQLREGGVWGVPRSGLVFTKKGNALVLTDRMPYDEAMPIEEIDLATYQQREFALMKRHFEAAGIEVRDETIQ